MGRSTIARDLRTPKYRPRVVRSGRVYRRFYDFDRDMDRHVEVLDRNGSLNWVEDVDTGECEWRDSFELKEV